MEAQGFAARPGPAVRAEPGVLETIAEALKGPFLLAITYAGADAAPAERRVAPHGVLLGMRRDLIACDENRDPGLRHFRVDRIRAARLLGSAGTASMTISSRNFSTTFSRSVSETASS